MSIITPDIDFDLTLYNTNVEELELNATTPLTYNETTHNISIANATQSSAGVITTSTQNIAGVKQFVNTTDQSQTSTGSIIISGGAQIAKKLYVGNAYCQNTPQIAQELTNKGYVDTLYSTNLSWKEAVIAFHDMTTPPETPTTGDRYISSSTTGDFETNNIYQWNGSAWEETIVVEGNAVYVSSDTSPSFANQCIMFNGTNWVQFSATINHDSLIGVHQNVNTTGTPQFSTITITNTTDQTDTQTGAFKVSGGSSIAKKLYVGSDANITGAMNSSTGSITSTTDQTDTQTGAFKVSGGSSIAKKLYVGTDANIAGAMNSATGSITATTDATDTQMGALKVAGGVGVAKKLYVGSDANITGAMNSSTGSITSTTEQTQTSSGMLICAGGVGIAKKLNVGGIVHIYNTTQQDFTSTGALVVDGGLGVIKTINCDQIDVLRQIQGTTAVIYGTQDATDTQTGALYVNQGGLSIYGNAYINQNLRVLSAIDASDTQTGAVKVSGGSSIAKKLYVGSDANITGAMNSATGSITSTTEATDTSTGAVIVSGGVGIAKRLQVGGAINGGSSITCNGTILSNSVRIGTSSNNTYIQPYDTVTNRVIGFADYLQATYVFSADCTNNICTLAGVSKVTDTTESNGTSTGAFQVLGGMSVQKKLYVGSGVIPLYTNTALGAIVVTGGISVAGRVHVDSSFGQTQTSTGAITIKGGVGVGENAYIGGNCVISGQISKGSGTFNIAHPDKSKKGWRLQHSFVECPNHGDNIYRYKIKTIDNKAEIELPQYFKYLNTNVQIFVNPENQFGTGYGTIDDNLEKIYIRTSEDGKFNVLVIGERKDEMVIKNYGQIFEPEIPLLC